MIDIIDSRNTIIESSINGVFIDVIKLLTTVNSESNYIDIYSLVSTAFSQIDTAIPFISGLNDVAVLVNSEFSKIGIGIKYKDSDALLLSNLQTMQAITIKSISDEYKKNVSNMLYTTRNNGVNHKTLRQLFIPGSSSGVGSSLQQVITTVSETMTMNAYAELMLKKGNESGISKYMYVGTLIKDSRKWCVDHIGKVFTLKQIDDWGKHNWVGKNPNGIPFVTRGGYRCRHHFTPIG